MKKAPLDSVALSLSVLIENNQAEAALNLLQRQLEATRTHQQAQQLLDLLKQLPPSHLRQPRGQELYLQTLCRAREAKAILAWSEGNSIPGSLQVYRAWALVREKQYTAALELLESISPGPTLDYGLLYRTLGEVLFRLGQADWQTTFERSRLYLQGVSLGRSLLDQGSFLNESGQRAAARICWSEALAHLREDPYYLAWARNSLGYSLLKDGPQEAEEHLLEAVRISRQAAAQEMRCRALSGLGAVRRGLGELERALSSYQQAAKAPGDVADHQLAVWGWGHTLRLMGRKEEALAKLVEARQLDPRESWIQADIAAVQAMLGEPLKAQASLQEVEQWGERSSIVRRVVEAEIARLRGRPDAARIHLEPLEATNLWVREELGCFPQLALIAGLASKSGPARYRVEVKPYGLLEVRVNGRAVPLPAVSKAGELLVFLLAQGKQASLEALTEQLSAKNKNRRKALWENIDKLRKALGWADSLQNRGKVYQLDPQAEWICSLESPLDQTQEFMPGYYSEWIEEWRQRLLVI